MQEVLPRAVKKLGGCTGLIKLDVEIMLKLHLIQLYMFIIHHERKGC